MYEFTTMLRHEKAANSHTAETKIINYLAFLHKQCNNKNFCLIISVDRLILKLVLAFNSDAECNLNDSLFRMLILRP